MIGQTLGHYRILEKVGSGGMGVVYRARDEQLERDVALKVLPSGTIANETSRRHFRNEALALAKLSHPNIETIYEFDSQDGTDFLVMEYIPGKTLADRLASGRMPEKDVILLGMQVVAALEEAHERGIVHRDLKPKNIAVTAKGQAKILDFGLAKLLSQTDDATADIRSETQAGAGTLPYMPPEQLQGESADVRADIYTMGAVLYEMATDCRAFPEPLASRLIDAILHRPPVPPRALDPRISPELERVILKCLDKDPARRYQTAKELLVDLRRLDSGSTPLPSPAPQPRPRSLWGRVAKPSRYAVAALVTLAFAATATNFLGWRDRLLGRPHPLQIHSLAVLPLENRSGDPEQDFFADGMTDELISELARISGIKVISRTSVMRFKNSKQLLPEIAKSLRVDGIVEGSVQRVGNRVRIKAGLIYAGTDRQLWTQSYDEDLRDVLTVESVVAKAIADEIQVQLTPQEEARLTQPRPENPEAHEAYLMGRYYWNMRTAEGLQKSITYLQHAIAIDPDYALAYAALSDSYHVLPELTSVSASEAFPKARTAALKALELDNSLSEAHSALASVKEDYDWDWKGAEADYKRAIDLSPGYMLARALYSNLLLELGRFPEALVQAKVAQQLDPLSVFANDNLSGILYYSGQYDQAIVQCRKTLEIGSASGQVHRHLAQILTQNQLYSEAVSELEKAIELSGGSPEAVAELGYVYGISGNADGANRTLSQLKSARDTSPYHLAIVYMGLGEKEMALRALDEAIKHRSPGVVHLKIAPQFKTLRTDQRFKKMLVDIGIDTAEKSASSILSQGIELGNS